MIPILATEELDANPSFAKVWEFLTTQLLERDGSSSRENEARNRRWQANRRQEPSLAELANDGTWEGESFAGEDAPDVMGDGKKKKPLNFEDELNKARLRRMKREILREVLAKVAYQSDQSGDRATDLEKRSRIPVPMKTEIQDLTNIAAKNQTPNAVKTMETDSEHQGMRMQSLGGLRDLILTVSAYLDANFDISSKRVIIPEEEELLFEDIGHFKSNTPLIASAISSHITSLETSLHSLSNLTLEFADHEDLGPPSTSLSLVESLQRQTTHLSILRTNTLPASLAQLSTTLHQLLSLQRQLLHLQLRHLETSKYGVLSRHNVSKIAFLDTVAQTMALKTQVMVLEARKEVELSPEAAKRRDFVRRKMGEVEKEEEGLDERIRQLEGVLGEYEALVPGGYPGQVGGGGEVMRKLGKRYKEIEEEMEGVKRDVQMLEARQRR